MAKELEHEEPYYYDLHPTEEDLMGESSLLPDGEYLRLYDSQGQRRLTETEAEAQRAEAEAEARRAETRRAQMEAEARRAAERRAEILAEKLRSLGINPDQV